MENEFSSGLHSFSFHLSSVKHVCVCVCVSLGIAPEHTLLFRASDSARSAHVSGTGDPRGSQRHRLGTVIAVLHPFNFTVCICVRGFVSVSSLTTIV